MFLNNLSKKQKIEIIIKNENKKQTLSNYIFPIRKIEENLVKKILNKLIDNIEYVTDILPITLENTTYHCITITAITINDLINSVLIRLKQDESIGIYQIGFNEQINKFTIKLFFYNDNSKKLRRIRQDKINFLLNSK